MNQPPSTTAAPPASSAARVRLRPARIAPLYSTTQVVAGIAMIPAVTFAHTDLMDRLGGITPKTLSQRLRELEDAGIVAAAREPGRREVWYRLTPAGADLGPVLDALSRWG